MVYDELAEFCVSWHGNTDIDRIADEAYLLWTNKPEEAKDPNVLPKLKSAQGARLNRPSSPSFYSQLAKQGRPARKSRLADQEKKALANSNLADLNKHLDNVRQKAGDLKGERREKGRDDAFAR